MKNQIKDLNNELLKLVRTSSTLGKDEMFLFTEEQDEKPKTTEAKARALLKQNGIALHENEELNILIADQIMDHDDMWVQQFPMLKMSIQKKSGNLTAEGEAKWYSVLKEELELDSVLEFNEGTVVSINAEEIRTLALSLGWFVDGENTRVVLKAPYNQFAHLVGEAEKDWDIAEYSEGVFLVKPEEHVSVADIEMRELNQSIQTGTKSISTNSAYELADRDERKAAAKEKVVLAKIARKEGLKKAIVRETYCMTIEKSEMTGVARQLCSAPYRKALEIINDNKANAKEIVKCLKALKKQEGIQAPIGTYKALMKIAA